MTKILFLACTILLLGSCSPKVKTSVTKRYPSLGFRDEVIVIGTSDEPPASAVEIGTVRIGDSGFSTSCGWDVVIEKAKIEARKSGGNVLKIMEHIPPNFASTCDRITAKIMRVENIDDLSLFSINKLAIIDSTWNYAKLYVFRSGGVGALVGYDLHLGDSIICRVTNNSKQEVIIRKKGLNKLWAKTESKIEIPIDIQFGREYYVRCSMGMGIMVGRPQLQLVDPMQGKSAYGAINTK